ncbi:MAG: ATP-binding protein [Burkholderiaceae bacterium]
MIDAPSLFPRPTDSLWTSLRYFALSRVVLASLLLLFVALDDPARLTGLRFDLALFLGASTAYLLMSLGYMVVASVVRRGFHVQLFLHALTDLVLLAVMMHAAGGAGSGLGVLMVAAVAGAAVLSTPRVAALFAAGATVLLLFQAMLQSLSGGSTEIGGLVPAAMTGAACFATALLINRLAIRLAAQEALASQRGVDLRGQLAVTQLVIAELPQGVVVLDERGGVRTMNRSAQQLFGPAAPWPALERMLAEQRPGAGGPDEFEYALGTAPEGGAPAGVADGAAALHRVRVRVLRPAPGAGGRAGGGADGRAGGGAGVVLVVEDLHRIEERAQQLKLASMGRLSASIAHEIRNPLAAIRHANGLLGEQLQAPTQQRLSRIVEDNSVRIDRIVEDVLSIARRERASTEPIDVARFLAALLPEIAESTGADPARIDVEIASDRPLSFDARQLRQVLVNLLTNALRYATKAPGAVRVEWRAGAGDQVELRVADDGPGLPREMLAHAFEPFFTTEARGTGLGLFLAREFCSANRATLRYEALPAGSRHRGVFVIVPGERAAP